MQHVFPLRSFLQTLISMITVSSERLRVTNTWIIHPQERNKCLLPSAPYKAARCACAWGPEPAHYLLCEIYISSFCCVSTLDLISDLSPRAPHWLPRHIRTPVMQFEPRSVCNAQTGFLFSNHRADRLRLPLNPPHSHLLFHQRLLTVFQAEEKRLHHFTAAYQKKKKHPEIYILVPDNKHTLPKAKRGVYNVSAGSSI